MEPRRPKEGTAADSRDRDIEKLWGIGPIASVFAFVRFFLRVGDVQERVGF